MIRRLGLVILSIALVTPGAGAVVPCDHTAPGQTVAPASSAAGSATSGHRHDRRLAFHQHGTPPAARADEAYPSARMVMPASSSAGPIDREHARGTDASDRTEPCGGCDSGCQCAACPQAMPGVAAGADTPLLPARGLLLATGAATYAEPPPGLLLRPPITA